MVELPIEFKEELKEYIREDWVLGIEIIKPVQEMEKKEDNKERKFNEVEEEEKPAETKLKDLPEIASAPF